jgi:hypothetical protein
MITSKNYINKNMKRKLNLGKSFLSFKIAKLTVMEYISKKILLYGAKSWTCTRKEESKIQAMEMKFLREILGKTRRDKIRNDDIREID